MKLFFSLFFCLAFFCFHSQAQHSAQAIGNFYSSACKLIEVDKDDNKYIAGYFSEEIQLGDCVFKASEGKNYLAKFDKSNQVVWAIQLAYPIKEILWAENSLYILGQFEGNLQIGGQMLQSENGFMTFFAKINSNGNFEWLKRFVSSKDAFAGNLAKDTKDNIYVSGSFNGNVLVGDTLLKEQKLRNLYLSKFDYKGNFLWARQASGGNNSLTGIYNRALYADGLGNIIWSGSLTGKADFSGQSLNSSTETFSKESALDNTDIFMAKYNQNGNLFWCKSVAQHAESQDILTDSLGNVYLTGFFKGSVNGSKAKSLGVSAFGDEQIKSFSDSLQEIQSEKLFLAKYSPLGSLIWVRQAEGNGISKGSKLIWNENKKEIVVAGTFVGQLRLGNEVFNASDSDIFWTAFQANGKYLWVKWANGQGNDELSDATQDIQGNIYLTGKFKKSLTFEAIQLQTEGTGASGFVLRYESRK